MKKIVLLFLLVLSVTALVGCGNTKEQSNVQSKKFTIVTSFYPLYLSTINITKDIPNVEVINMTKSQTGCLHDYQLTPEDMILLEKADVFVVNGGGMESFLEKVITANPNLKIVESGKNIPLLKSMGHNHEEHEHHGEAEVNNAEVDPHLWVSVSNNILQVRNIAEQLASINQENAVKFQGNANLYINKLELLRDDMKKKLAPFKGSNIFTFHEAFGYFAKEFEFNIVGVIEREPGTEPSPKELEETIEKVKQTKVKALFTEPQYPAKAATVISQETGVKVYSLDPVVTGESNAQAYDDYLNKMNANLKILQEALQ